MPGPLPQQRPGEPDPPPETRLMSTWSGDPVDFYDNVSYVCAGENLYFEWSREMVEYNVSCLPGGAWDKPIIWPICLPCKYSNVLFQTSILHLPPSCKLYC